MILAKHVLKLPFLLSKLHKFLFLEFTGLTNKRKTVIFILINPRLTFVKLDYTLENEILIF